MGQTNRGAGDRASALSEIKDGAIILSLGNDYLCQEPILVKIGRVIDRNVEKVRKEISSLIGQFPGKFTPEIDTDEILAEIQGTARVLQQPDEELSEKCRLGELGKGLEDQVRALTRAVNDIRAKVEGRGVSYSTKDSLIGLFTGLGKAGGSLGGIMSRAFKIVAVLAGVAILVGVYLFITMDRESGLLKNISAAESEIRSEQEAISGLEVKRKEIVRRIASIEKKDPSRELSREEKIAIIDLEMEKHKIDEEKRQAQSEISLGREIINENTKKIEAVRESPFFKRLLQPVLAFFTND